MNAKKIWEIMTISLISLIVLAGLLYGCAALQAESGVGVTAGKTVVAGIGAWGLGAGVPQVVVYRYDYQVQPRPTPPGTPPAPPAGAPPPVGYQTIYGPPSYNPQADPTRIILSNPSYDFTVRVSVDGGPEFRLAPRQTTIDLAMAPDAKHHIRLVVEKPTRAFGILELTQYLSVYIDSRGRSQTISLPVYDW